MQRMRSRVFGVIALALVAATGRAQYDAPREYAPVEIRYLSVGAMPREFAPREGFPGGDSLAIRYNVWMPVVGFHQKLVDVMIGYTRYTIRGATRSAAFVGLTMGNDVPLVMARPLSFVLPLVIAVDYTKSQGPGVEREDFNMASVGVGTGLKVRVSTPGTEFNAYGVGAYHFSFEGLNTGHGSSAAFIAEASLVIRTFDIVDGVVIGYRFRHQTWNAADGRLNYRVTTHGPYIGVLL
jgi:hypothetical protein